MPDDSDRMVEFRGRIPYELSERFMEHFPQHGANSWFIRTAVEEFLAYVEERPAARESVRQAITHYMESEVYGHSAASDRPATA